MNTIHEKVKELASKANIPIKELASNIGMTENGYYAAIKNSTLRIDKLEMIANFFGVHTSYFFGVSENIEVKTQKQATKQNDSVLLREMVDELKGSNTFLKDQVDFLKSLVLSKLDRLEKYNFGLNEGGGLGKGSDVLGVVSNCLWV
jgi:transcriptional regulator with XRE-family HTH domain